MGWIRKARALLWLWQGLPLLLLKGGFKVSSGTAEWSRSRYGTDFDNSELASPVLSPAAAMKEQLKPYYACLGCLDPELSLLSPCEKDRLV